MFVQIFSKDLSYLKCIDACASPRSHWATVYLLLRFLIFLIPTEMMWYIFYYIPKQFNARLISGHGIDVSLSGRDESSHSMITNSLIDDMKRNHDPSLIQSFQLKKSDASLLEGYSFIMGASDLSPAKEKSS